jgi:hypothetical protein
MRRFQGDAVLRSETAFARVEPGSGRGLGLDLLRAAAVLMVLCSHWTSHFLGWWGIAVPSVVDSIGDTGVEVFFALSGFLIGRILIGIAADRPTWRDYRVFLLRRAMRTLPLYFAWLLLLLALFPPQQDFEATALRFLTLTQNLIAEMPPDYYFVVSWSLTVEEWFYALFGLAFIFLARHTGGQRAMWACLPLFLLPPLLLRLAFDYRGPMVFFRIDEIAYGVLAAAVYARCGNRLPFPGAALAAGLALIAVSLAGVLPDHWALPLTSNLQVIGGVLCLPAALRLAHLPGWLRIPVQWTAGRSYALYLMHLTLLKDVVERMLLEPGLLPPAACAVLAVLLPLPLAELSFRLLEGPMMRLRPAQGGPRRPRATVGPLRVPA